MPVILNWEATTLPTPRKPLMAQGRDSRFDGRPIDLFKRKREGTVNRILQRAEKLQQKEHEKQQRDLSHALRGSHGVASKLGKTLDKIIAHQGRATKKPAQPVSTSAIKPSRNPNPNAMAQKPPTPGPPEAIRQRHTEKPAKRP
jgi:hypothetical protein